RSYDARKRQEAAEDTRERVLEAARSLLMAGKNPASVSSIDAVARKAKVARMTVYNQFGSKAGLLEALFDSIALRGPFGKLPQAMQPPDPRDSPDEVIAICGTL